MNQMMKIQNQEIQVKEFNGQRVITFKDIDLVHERPSGTASRNFTANRRHLVDGEDYYIVHQSDFQNNEIRCLGFQIPNRGLTLITESGYLMLVKSFTDDLAWAVQRQLVNCYFKVKELESKQVDQVEISEGTDLSRKERIKIAEILATSSQYNLKAVIDMVKGYMSPEVVASYLSSNQISCQAETSIKMKLSPDFSKKLVSWMKSNGLNQNRLCEVLELPKSTVSIYCNGKSMPKEDRVKKIAERMNVSVDYFYE